MGILDIKPAKKNGVKALIALAGATGSGKTLTALLIARGMVSKASEVGLLDTEHGRGSFYADKLDGEFMIAQLQPPFSPSRYREAIIDFEKYGVKVLVIDSVSHEWEGEGGCEDIADAALLSGKKMADWKKAKKEHKYFMKKILYADIHLILSIRAREKTDFKDPNKPISLGIQPICEKNFMFEMMASVLVENEGKTQKHIKVPDFLKEAFGNGDNYLGINTGRKIIEWINTGEKEDPELTKIKSEMLMACEMGVAGLLAVWNKHKEFIKKLSPKQKAELDTHKNTCKASAEEYEKQAKKANETPRDVLSNNLANSKQETPALP